MLFDVTEILRESIAKVSKQERPFKVQTLPVNILNYAYLVVGQLV